MLSLGRALVAAGVFAVAFAAAAVAGHPPSTDGLPPLPPVRLGVVLAGDDPHNLDLARLVPADGKVNHVWFVPAGKGRPQVVVAWQRGYDYAAKPPPTDKQLRQDPRRYLLTLWNPEGRTEEGFTRWVPHLLVKSSPWPIGGVNLADVTRDGHLDLLVGITCTTCNHGAFGAFVTATFGRHVRTIYGHDRHFFFDKDPRLGVHCRELAESSWGSSKGLLWFDTYRDHWLSGKRLLTFLSWTDHGWRTIRQIRTTREEIERLNLHG